MYWSHNSCPMGTQATVDQRAAVVHTREALHQSQTQGIDDEQQQAGGGADRMRNVAARTKMAQIAKAQASELALLRKELDRLRQKAFPAFPV